jgi:hypothetical protein
LGDKTAHITEGDHFILGKESVITTPLPLPKGED